MMETSLLIALCHYKILAVKYISLLVTMLIKSVVVKNRVYFDHMKCLIIVLVFKFRID